VARVHRIGQERPVRVKRYIVKDTVEVRTLLALLVQMYRCLAHMSRNVDARTQSRHSIYLLGWCKKYKS